MLCDLDRRKDDATSSRDCNARTRKWCCSLESRFSPDVPYRVVTHNLEYKLYNSLCIISIPRVRSNSQIYGRPRCVQTTSDPGLIVRLV